MTDAPAPPASDGRPGLDPRRLARLVSESVERCELDLSGCSVLTEAATGAYSVTPVLAALAGAEVVALTRDTRYGSVSQVREVTASLAAQLGVAQRITVTEERRAEFFGADVVTNSGHVRPIAGPVVASMRPGAVLPLMFEAWEIEAGRTDLDLAALLGRGVIVGGTNERHPDVDVFSYLGAMAVAQLADAGVAAYRGRIAVLCDNDFEKFVVAGLEGAGALVTSAADVEELLERARPDALVVAVRPTGSSVLSGWQLEAIAARWPDVVICQFWGDVDRALCDRSGLACWPATDPGAGHMGVLPSRVGPEPVVRLQAGGLKVAQVLRIPAAQRSADDLAYLDALPESS